MAQANKKAKLDRDIGDVSVVLLQHWSQQVDDLGTKLNHAKEAASVMQDKYDRLLRQYRDMILNMNETLYHNGQYADALTSLRIHFDHCIQWIPDADNRIDAIEGLDAIVDRFNRNMDIIDLTADETLSDSDEE